LNAEGVNHAARTGCSLIVTVDSASSDAELIQRARTKGVDVVVTDHHETDMEGTLPYPLINPKRKDATYPFRAIAGVAVAFKLGWHLAVSLLSLSPGEWDSIATEWYPLVFLGTYGDKVPLRDENWTLAHIGYHALKKTTRKGLRILTEMLSENGDWDEAMLQKMISVFSTGKTESWGNNLSFRILTETDITFLRETISQLIQKSDAWHAEANANYKKILSEATYDPGTDIVTVYCPAVPHEYLGFCASRLKERYGKPIVAMSEKGDTIVGEARAPKGFDILRVLSGTNQLFLSFGGHKPACGFALDKEKLDEVRSYLSQDFPDIASVEDTKTELRIIGELPLEDLTDEIKGEILSLIPFGADNSPPLFLAKKISFSQGEYSLCVPETGEQKQIDLRGNSQSWTGMNGKPLLLDVVYYLNTAGTLIIADSRPSVFNESGDRTYPDSGNGQR
jgi:single-stranded-DNA-specific exonuclease